MIMKVLVLSLFATVAQADTLTVLIPPPSPVANVRYVHCAGESFTADGLTINGACQYTLKCSARYCYGANYTYSTTWDLVGNPTLGALRKAPPVFGSPSAVLLDGTYYYFQGASIYGAILAGTGYGTLLWQP